MVITYLPFHCNTSLRSLDLLTEIPFQEEHRFQGKPAWLDSFLDKTFFDECSVHNLCKNDRNRYCINCNLALCQYCIASGSHNGHNILKLYRHVYKDVVPVGDMGNFIDCSKIQVRDQIKLLQKKSSSSLIFSYASEIGEYGNHRIYYDEAQTGYMFRFFFLFWF